MRKLRSKHIIQLFCFALTATILFMGCGKGCGKKEIKGVEAGSLQLIPVDSNIIVGLDWKKIVASPLGEKFKKEIPSEFAPLLEGIDGITLGVKIEGVNQEPSGFLAIVSGKLDSAALLAELTKKAKEEGQEVGSSEYEGVKIYTSPKDPMMGLAFLDGKGIVGQVNSIKKVIDLSKKKGESIEKNKELMDRVKAVDTSKMLWAVGIVPEGAIPAGGGQGNPLSALSNVKALDLAVDLSKDLTVDLGIIAGAQDQVKQIETMANSYKTLFGSSLAQKDPTLGKVLNGISIGSDGNRLLLSLKLDQATVEEISKKAEEKQSAPAAEPASEGEAEKNPVEEGEGSEAP